jgi:hypothetical protein
MPGEQKKMIPINYTNREFETIRNDLLQIAQKYYPDSFQDWSEGSFGSLMVDAVSYIGDQLSFYLDYNVNEAFLDTAYQYTNIIRHGRALGYKELGRPSTYGRVAVFILVPASSTGLGPDSEYLPVLRRGASFSATNGSSFVLTENVDFANPKNQVVVGRVNDTTGAPTFFAVKAYGNVVSGRFGQEIITVGDYEKFKKVTLSSANVSEIISVFDDQGNEYFEVEYLAQDMIYKELTNNNYKNDNVPSILKPMIVSRKFTVERDGRDVSLQFGSGKDGETNIVAEPQSVAIDVFGKSYTSDTTFDPSRLSKNESFGIVPQNTRLTISYRASNNRNSNVAVAGINKPNKYSLVYTNPQDLNTGTVSNINASLEVLNETPITGDTSGVGSDEIKRRIFDTFPTQNRAVTQADYENIAYRMPAQFGSVKRVSVQKDPDSLKRNLNMYVVSEDSNGKLAKTNSTIKNNLKTWVDNYRMINDTVDILDPYIINIGIEFVIQASVGINKFDALQGALDALRNAYEVPLFIGEALTISDIYSELKKVNGVLDIERVKITNKIGSNYSGVYFDINRNLSPAGTKLITPQNAILEVKFPAVDIKGKVK